MRQLLVILFLVLGVKFGLAQGFYLSSAGTAVFDESKLTLSEAGDDFRITLRSSTDIYLSINSDYYWNMKNEKWRVYIHKSDIEWDEGISLQVKRTGLGTPSSGGKAFVKAGASWREINNASTYLFRGKDKVSDIPLSFRVKNLSLTMGARDFETDVIFTIYDY